MAESEENKGRNTKTASLMISYSRKDKDFVKHLYDGLIESGFPPGKDSIWVDWEGIPLSADWMAEITNGIQSANAFIFVISPDSVASEVCQKEIEIAVAANKRFIPILYREPGKDAKLHEKISSHNWIFIHDEKELKKNMPALVDAINTDLDWLAKHTRFYNRASEWDSRGRNDSYLVRGSDLDDAETFISEGAAGKEPAPTPLHIEYVKAAQKFAETRRRRNQIIAAVVGVALLGLSIFAFIQRGDAIDNFNLASTKQVEAEQNAKIAAENEELALAAQAEAEKERNEAVKNRRIANAHVLAAEAVNLRESDSQLSLVLALLSIQETEIDGPPLLESQSALFTSLNTPNVLYTWDIGEIVWDTAYDPTGKYIVIGDDLGEVQVFDAESREFIYSVQVGNSITALDFSLDGSRLAVVSDDWSGDFFASDVQVIDIESGDKVFSLHTDDDVYVNDIAFSPNGQLIATAGDDGVVRLWLADSGTLRTSLFGHADEVSSLDFSSDGSLLVSGSYDETAIVWDVGSGSINRTLRQSSTFNQIYTVAFSPSDDQVMMGGYKTVLVWDAFTGDEIQQLNGNQASVYDVEFTADESSMMTASSGIKIFESVYGLERYNLSAHSGEVNSISFSQDGNLMVTGSWDYTAKLWATNLKIETLRLKQHLISNIQATYSPDGKWILTVGDDGGIYLHDAVTGEFVNGYSGYYASFNPQDPSQILAFNYNQALLWVIGKNDPIFVGGDPEVGLSSAVFSPNGDQVIAVDYDGALNVWDIENGGEDPSIWDNDFVGDILDVWSGEAGNLILTTEIDDDGNNNAVIRDLDDLNAEPLYLIGHLDYVLAGAFSHDGKYVYTGGYDNTIRKWDAETGQMLLVLPGHTGRVLDIDVSPDDTLIASASADTTVRIWEVESGKEKFTYRGNYEDANSVEFNPDGTRVLTASSDKVSKEFVIDLDTLKSIAFEYELRQLTTEECLRFLKRENCILRIGDSRPAAPADDSQKSGTGDVPVTLFLINESSVEVDLFWVDFEGTELLYYTVGLEDGIEQGTYSTHLWRVRDLDGNLVMDYRATEDPEQVIPITDADLPASQPDSTSDDDSSSVTGSFYTEEFDGRLSPGWFDFMASGEDRQLTSTFEGGALRIELSQFDEKFASYYLVNSLSEYSSVQLELVTGNNGNNANGVSLVCQYSDAGWYEFTVSNAGVYSISAYDPSIGYIVLANGGSPEINTGKTTNTYTATCEGSMLSLAINGVLVNSKTDTRFNFTEGKIGIGVSFSSTDMLPVDVYLDSLTVREP